MEIIKAPTDCRPEDTGYDSSRIEWLNSRLADMTGRRLIHGAAYCIIHRGRVIAHAAIGRGSRTGIQVPMQPDTVFSAASLTKVFTAAAVMQLTEDGILNLNDPAGKYLPQLSRPPFDRIRLIHLLTHTSGLYPDTGCFDEPEIKGCWQLIDEAAGGGKVSSSFDWITPGISNGLRRPTGTEWQYCSFGFALLGEIITRASGISCEKFITDRIISPLGLKSTGFSITPETAQRAFIYSDKPEPGPEPGSVWSLIPPTAGGLWSTVYDLARFGNMFICSGRPDGVRILGRKSVEKISKVQLHDTPDYCWNADEPNRLYGVGFDIRRTPSFNYSDNTIMHEGAGASSLDIDLDEQLCAAWFVPFDEGAGGWSAEPLYNVQNIIWSGLV